jgi:hypothetical protein
MMADTVLFPQTVNQAVVFLAGHLTFKDKTRIVNMSDTELIGLHFSFGIYLHHALRLPGNSALMASCCREAELPHLDAHQAVFVLLTVLRDHLRETGQGLRRVV